MIISFILTLFNNFIVGLISILPTGSLPVFVSQAIAYFVGIANSFSYIIPVATLFQAFTLVISVDVAILAWHFLNWLIRKIPGMQ